MAKRSLIIWWTYLKVDSDRQVTAAKYGISSSTSPNFSMYRLKSVKNDCLRDFFQLACAFLKNLFVIWYSLKF